MLERAQEMVSTGKLRMLAFGNQPAIGQTAKADQGVRRTQPGIATAKGDLQRLRDKLDFTNAPATQLDVETLFFSLSLSINLFLGRSHVHQGCGNADIGPKNATDYPSGKTLIESM